MPRFFLEVTPHLEYEELAQRVQQCQDPIEKKRWLAIQLLSQSDQPMTTQQVATALGYSPDWGRKQVRRYNRLRARGLVSGRQW